MGELPAAHQWSLDVSSRWPDTLPCVATLTMVFFSLKKFIIPACRSLLIGLFKYILLDLIQASSLAALRYVLIFAFI